MRERLVGLAPGDIAALDFASTTLVRPDLAGFVAPRASLERVDVEEGRLAGLSAPEGLFREVEFRECRLELASFPLARFRRVTFVDCRMQDVDLREARLTEVCFERCDLSRADFSNARLERCRLRGCVLDDLRGAASLRGAAMTWNDVVAGAAVWAGALGIELLDE